MAGETSEPKKREPMSVREAGRKGGKATRARDGPEFFTEIGQKGGRAVSRLYPSEHFKEIGRKGGRRVAELVERAKRMEEPGAEPGAASGQESE